MWSASDGNPGKKKDNYIRKRSAADAILMMEAEGNEHGGSKMTEQLRGRRKNDLEEKKTASS